ncbi:MAG TPA: helix-turn-helix domain-containing protein [Candidatus Limnocylindrales bacterium]
MERGRRGVGELLRAQRVERGLSQEELAETAGLSARAISDIERGLRRRLYPDTARRLADALDLDDQARATFVARARGASPEAAFEQEVASAVGPIPRPAGPLIGRESELELTLQALRTSRLRLVTITGTGGIGKTRLAIEAAIRSSADVVAGVHFVSLAEVREAGLVLATIVRSLGIPASPADPSITLTRYLASRETLLVLDNLEHLLDAAPLLARLLSSCPRLRLLVTSRAPLGLAGEQLVPVPPLALPPVDAPDLTPAELARYPAVELLVERVRAIAPDFGLDDVDPSALRDVACRLAGIPLAIELAAPRLRHMSLAALEQQLAGRFDVLTRGPRDLPERHRTMQAAIAWSYELVDPASQRLFRALSVFAGGCTLAGAEAVGGAAPETTLDALSTLIDHGLVFLDTAHGEDRYRMLEVIRSYAAELASEAGEAEDDARRHADHHLALARSARPGLLADRQDAWYARLHQEHDNLRAALAWLLEHDADAALELTAALWMFWRQHGDFAEGRQWLSRALAGGGSAASRVDALWGAAWLAHHQGDYQAMATLAAEHLSLARRLGDRRALRNALTEQGMLEMVAGRHVEALRPFREALELARELDEEWILALSLFNLGHASTHAGDASEGERLLREAHARFRSLGDRRFTARAQGQLAVGALLRGDAESAMVLASASLRAFAAVGERWGIAEGLELVSAATSQPLAAARIAGAAARLREETATEPMPFDWDVIGDRHRTARGAVGEEAWHAAWEEGRSLDVGAALECAASATR